MAGSVLSVGVLASAAALTAGLSLVTSASAFGGRVAGIADAAALAAADAASGAVAGVPCESAARVAEIQGARVARCDLDGLVATVTVSAQFGHLPATASARAGPPPPPDPVAAPSRR